MNYPPIDSGIFEHRKQAVLYDKKWIIFLKRSWPFRFIPFVDFVFGAGSMAVGDVTPASDFDVIMGAKNGRIFTARFFSILFFGLLGWRRKKLDHQEVASNKICLNHFVTKNSYRLAAPHTSSWKNLYASLVPIFGKEEEMDKFWRANSDWVKIEKKRTYDLRHRLESASTFKSLCEKILNNRIGDVLEKFLRHIQVRRIEESLKKERFGHEPRIIYSDAELEFHPDTKERYDNR